MLAAAGLLSSLGANAARAAEFACGPHTATIVGTPGDDAGTTALVGTSGPDVIVGLGGNDEIFGLDGDDIICGGRGNDLIDGGVGDDIIRGGNEDDTVIGGFGANDVHGGSGFDTVSFQDASGPVTTSLHSGGTATWAGASDRLQQFERVIGSAFDDTIDGSLGDDVIEGGRGNDRIRGLGGADRLLGGDGNDRMRGNAGDDVLDGGAGSDLADGGHGTDVCIDVELVLRCDDDVQEPFVSRDLSIPEYHLRDVGVADIDSDNNLDIFTVNHFSDQAMLMGDGFGHFADAVDQLGFHQDPNFPGLEDVEFKPQVSTPGVHLYFAEKLLYIESVDSGTATDVGLTIIGALDIIEDGGGFVTSQTTTREDDALAVHTFDLTITGSDRLVVDIFATAAPIEVALATDTELEAVFVGADALNPVTHQFALYLRDRHAYAWADIDGDGRLDLAAARGGLRRRIATYPIVMRDELLVFEDGKYHDTADAVMLEKSNCAGRAVRWVDIDNDGLLDLSIVCATPEPSQLHRQNADGTFTEIGHGIGLGFVTYGPVTWSDIDLDLDADALLPEADGLVAYRNNGGTFTRELLFAETIEDTNEPSVWRRLDTVDFDADGDLDIFVADSDGNRLLQNDGGTYRLEPLEALGLPAASKNANWVDIDNDGDLDLYSHPDGLFVHDADGTFTKTQLLTAGPKDDKFLTSTWFDMDNDGDRDLLGRGDWNTDRTITIELFENTGTGNDWLQLKLVGPPGNREGTGAVTRVTSAVGVALQEVGSAEGSRFSQGHYRLYFGLGSDPGPVTVDITWPDGTVQSLDDVAVNQLLTVHHP